MRLARGLAPALAVGVAASLAACQSSQDRSAELAKHGYSAASSFLNSTTYGGGSWWAQATLTTGVVVRNEVEYAVTRAEWEGGPGA